MNRLLLSIFLTLFIFDTVKSQTIRYQQNIRGGFATAANALTLKSGTWVKTDGGTTTSSYSDLILPAGSIIVKAFLYAENYGGYSLFGGPKIASINFKVPGGSYVLLNSASTGFIGNPVASSYGQFIIDVTNLMPASGYVSTLTAGGNAGTTGRYSVSDPTLSSGSISPGEGWGWSLFVIYTNPASKFRNVTIADACNENSADIIIPNVSVPSTGAVNAVVAITGSYGDPQSGSGAFDDDASFGKAGTALTGLIDPTTGVSHDILNSTVGFCAQNNVSADGGPAMSGNYTGRNPYNVFAEPNVSGVNNWYSYYYDSDIFNAFGILPNSPVPINVELKQQKDGQDVIGFGAYVISVDIAAASIKKSISPSAIAPGGTATYTWTIDNANGAVINLTGINFTDNLPSGIIIANPANSSVTGVTAPAPNVTASPGGTVVTVSGLNVNAGQIATISVNVTNVPGQLNPSCNSNPVAFTNGLSNLSGLSANLVNEITDQCLIVDIAVPINLLDFKAKNENGLVNLLWSTATEKNNKEFVIERGNEYSNFQPIGEIDGGKNTSTINYYLFTDKHPIKGISYYRLKQLDFDGKISYSNTVSITKAVDITPSVTVVWKDDALFATVSVDEEKNITATLFDLNGRSVASGQISGPAPGIQTITLNTGNTPSGVYLLLIESDSKAAKQVKVIKW